jgi:tRNA threonylcarbamoyladenosine biosynthesis protein TsaE
MDLIISSSAEETRRIAADFAKKLGRSDTVLLQGDLGAGKTEFVKGLVKSLGGELSQVSSPTFTLIHEYLLADGILYHADLYRCEDEQAVMSTGIEECFGNGICVIEWSEKLGNLPPSNFWIVKINMRDNGSREIRIFRANKTDRSFSEIFPLGAKLK